MDYKDKIKQQAIQKNKKKKLIKEGIEKLKSQGIDTIDMEQRLLGYIIETKEDKIKKQYPTLPLTNTIFSGIYQIQNKVTNNIYIGQSQNIETCWKSNINKLRNCKFQNTQLQSDYDEYGEDCFEFSTLEITESNISFYKYHHMITLQKQGFELYNSLTQKNIIHYKLLKTFINNNSIFKYLHKFEDCLDKQQLVFDFVIYDKNSVDIKEIIILHSILNNELTTEEQLAKHELHYQMKIDYCKTNGYKYSIIKHDSNGYFIESETR